MRTHANRWWWAAVLAVAFIGLVLRAWNLDFDQRQHLHPDERHWSLTASNLAAAPEPAPHGTAVGPVLDWLDGQRSPANAYRGADTFVYGPVTLAAARGLSGWLYDGVVEDSGPASTVASAIDRLGVPLLTADGSPRFDDGYNVDLIGRLLGVVADAATIVVIALIGRRIGGRWAGLAAAGFAAFSVIAIQHAHFFGSEPLLGLMAALTVLATLRIDRTASWFPALTTGLLAGLAAGATVAVKLSGVALAAIPMLACAWLVVSRRRWTDVARFGAVMVGAAVAFRVLFPSAFDGLGLGLSDTFLDDLRRTDELNNAGLPPSVQWAGRIPVLEPLRWLTVYTIGPATAIAAVVGSVWLVRARARIGIWTSALAVAMWVVPLVWVFRDPVTTERYFVPMLPALFACAGYGAVATVRHALARRDNLGRLVVIGAGALGALAVVWGVAFVVGVHGDDHTRVVASRWIGQNLAPGSVLSSQAWDDGLPLAIGGVEPTDYEYEQFEMFGTDNVDKTRQIAEQLTRIDYVVESSRRVSDAVPRLPATYPSTTRFFDGLDSGALGFERAATFTSPPGLGWWTLDDTSAEEAFSVYDHPEVRIWKRVRDLAPDDITRALDPAAASMAVTVHPDDGRANGAMSFPDERATNDAIGTYDDDFDTTGSPLVHVVGWLVLVELLALATLVVFAPALRRLPDAGAGIAATLGLGITSFVVFVAVTWGPFELTRGLVTRVVAGWLAVAVGVGWARRRLLRTLWVERRGLVLRAQAVFLIAFGVMLALRAANPDLWHVYRGGEKLFELEMLTSVLRTRTLPPYDPWFTGGTLNYYYGGYLLLSVPARVLGTTPTLVMNVGVALVAAMAAGAAHTAGAAVADSWRRTCNAESGPDHRAARIAGLVAPAFVLLLPSAAVAGPVVGRLLGSESGTFDWWALSRMIPASPVVTEFPAWSLLFGDLHPHLIDLPVLITIVAVALAWYRALTSSESWRAPLLLGVATGLLCGLVQAINTWDLPLAAVMAALVPLVAVVTGASRRRCAASAGAGAVVALVGWAPYAWRTVVTDSGVELEPLATPFTGWLQHFGFFAACTIVIVAVVVTGAVVSGRLRVPPAVLAAGFAVVALAVVVSLAVPDESVTVASVGLALAATGGAVLARRDHTSIALSLVLSGAAWFLIAGIEVFSVTNDFERQNTVFKGWFQAWVLLAVGSAAGLVALATVAAQQRAEARGSEGARAPLPARVARPAVAVLAIVAVLLTSAFVQLGVPARLDDRVSTGGFSLDGLAFLAEDDVIPDPTSPLDPGADRALVDWLRANVAGTPTIVEAPGDDYGWNGRIAALTGLPSVIGWPYHQSQQRRDHESVVRSRVGDVASLYQDGEQSTINAVLQRYDVGYVVFGSVEATLAGRSSRRELLVSPCLEVVFAQAESFVAEVDHGCLAQQPGALPTLRSARE